MSNAIEHTPHFGLPIPKPPRPDWGNVLRDFFLLGERALGTNCNLILAADTGYGAGVRYSLAEIASPTRCRPANPTGGRWGRLLLQATMVDDTDVLGRLIGISDIAGFDASGHSFGETVYHDADSGFLTPSPEGAAIVVGNRTLVLPLGMLLGQGQKVFFNGTLPLMPWPVILSGDSLYYKPGISDPVGNPSEGFDTSGNLLRWSATGLATGNVIDFLFPFPIRSDFVRWMNLASPYWAFRTRFTTTNGTLVARSAIDTAGSEHLLGLSAVSAAAYTNLTVLQSELRGIGGTWDPGKNGYMRLRFRATGNAAAVNIESHGLIQYHPRVEWAL